LSTTGIASDKLHHFAVVFSALIHDVDRSGVPATIVLAKENEKLAALYKGMATAERNSVGVAWNVF
jgi:hypothetical protein